MTAAAAQSPRASTCRTQTSRSFLRAFESSGRSEVFAHSSPIYFVVGGQPVVVPESARDLVQKIDLLIAHTEVLDGFRRESHRKETLDVYRAARDVLNRRLASR
jgi:hypothetical protein